MKTRGFFLGFLLAALVIAGAVSYLADSNPGGLDHATLQGCAVDSAEQLTGSCIAQNAQEHRLASSPLADYAVEGAPASTGVAGVIGVTITLVFAGGLFWLLRKRSVKS
jgi:cobalt/nickel transport protein